MTATPPAKPAADTLTPALQGLFGSLQDLARGLPPLPADLGPALRWIADTFGELASDMGPRVRVRLLKMVGQTICRADSLADGRDVAVAAANQLYGAIQQILFRHGRAVCEGKVGDSVAWAHVPARCRATMMAMSTPIDGWAYGLADGSWPAPADAVVDIPRVGPAVVYGLRPEPAFWASSECLRSRGEEMARHLGAR